MSQGRARVGFWEAILPLFTLSVRADRHPGHLLLQQLPLCDLGNLQPGMVSRLVRR